MKKSFLVLAFFCLTQLFHLAADTGDTARLTAFSDPARIWGSGVERVVEEAYRLCFNTRILGDRVMNIRMPFAQDNERDKLTDEEWGFLGGGKGNPVFLWTRINEILDSDDFLAYAEALSDGREKVVIFDLPSQSWTVSRDLFDIARMKAGSYQGLLHRPYVLVSGRGLEESDVYNYLYSIGLLGMDCSGFVWHVLSHVAAAGGIDLGSRLSRTLGVMPGVDPSRYVGTSFYNSGSSRIVPVNDQIRNLRPADVLLFRAADGGMGHAAVIQSVDLSAGVIRYLQSTDEAPLAERGVHESFIYFNPGNTAVSLSDPSLTWTQRRYPPFPGERASPFSDDGKRYRAFPELGGGRVVRLLDVTEAIERINQR
ncbi:MAG: peptidoglycan endopeptidase [Treponema sp.]|nr:peptidoglycan endopeptidase [Treponema sp.]